MQFFGVSQTPSLVSTPKNCKNSTSTTANTRIVLNAESKIDSSLRVSEASVAIQKSCEAPESRPLRGAKNRIEGCSSATADFLLEAEKRGSPPKSEKRQLLARRGERGGGCSPFARKNKRI
ncbi:hypothetical protein [Helicobacter sp. 23-1045]